MSIADRLRQSFFVDGSFPEWGAICDVVAAAEKSHLCNAPNTHIGVALTALKEKLDDPEPSHELPADYWETAE